MSRFASISGRIRRAGCISILTWLGCRAETDSTMHLGMSNASAVGRVSDELFAAASDEDNVIRVYSRKSEAPPVATLDLTPHLGLSFRHSPEADIEGAAVLGNRIYWIGSHSRNKDGKPRPNRHRFFATDFELTNGIPVLRFSGRPTFDLVEQMQKSPELAPLRLAEATAALPDRGGLNIEALLARREGGLWIGFRSPLKDDRAILVPLLNPEELLEGKPARFATPKFAALDGLGLRDAVSSDTGEIFLLAGREGRGGSARLYRWDSDTETATRLSTPALKDANPEAIAWFPTTKKPRLLVLSDDGNRELARPSFRSFWIKTR